MLDYEIMDYKVNYFRKGDISFRTVSFATEEAAIEFIKVNRHKWEKYSLIKIQTAIIDF